ncbi:vascular endothelial growth factor B [Pelobates fuscus]|uniref:vascular endothelial growth factor B n=1 Tax=Pelobates fuscus TaxID=191477 RepID=UPI002FE48DEB
MTRTSLKMGKMEFAQATSSIWLALLLTYTFTQVSGSQSQLTHKSEGLSWMDLYNRSQCQPRLVLRSLLVEFPQFSDSLFLPPCVSVMRCSGCCLDEGLSCVPTHTHNITMQVIKTKLLQSELTEIGITQHTRCECRPKEGVLLKANRLSGQGEKKMKKRRRKGKKGREANKKRSRCAPCGQRRTLNPKTCKCVCDWSEEKCHKKAQKFNKEKCRCETITS